MSKLDLPERALDLASQAGDMIRDMAPKASSLISAGAKLGAVKAGARVGLMVVRRNPVIAAATLAGAGLVWYAARRRARNAENGNGQTLEGSARRIDARREEGKAGKEGTRTRRASGTRRATSKRTRGTTATTETRTEH